MSSAKSRYLESAFLKYVFKATAMPTVGGIYLAAMTAPAGDTGGGVEVSGGSYGRVLISASQWDTLTNPDTTGTRLTNIATITFPAPTADWGTIVQAVYYDALTGGNELYYGALSVPVTVTNGGAALSFAPGTLIIRED